jgi:hypothetical protein
MPSRYPQYLTFGPGKLEEEVRQRMRLPPGIPVPLPAAPPSGVPRTSSRGQIIRSHRFAVIYPDGQTGACSYERKAPAWHVFRYTYDDTYGGDGKDGNATTALPHVHWSQPLAGAGGEPAARLAAIETKGQELAERSFKEAIERERQNYFARASEPTDGSRKKDPAKYRMSAKRAKELGGKYALCYRSPQTGHLIPLAGPAYEKIEEANEAWCEMRAHRRVRDPEITPTVVGCCNRLDRCWELPRYNPLYKEHDPRHPHPPLLDPHHEPGAAKHPDREGEPIDNLR